MSENNNYDIVILSLARNCEHTIEIFFNFLENLTKKGFNVLSVVGENNSEDFTFNKLQKYSESSDLLQLLDTTFIEKFDDRIIRLSKARQYIKDHLHKKNIQSKYICVVDLDEVISSGLTIQSFLDLKKTLDNNSDKLFAVSAKSIPFYYDILNYEDENNLNLDVIKLQNRKDVISYFERKEKIYNLQKRLTNLDEIVSISSFNGLCLYYFNDFKEGYYYQEQNNNPTPEHLNLNRIISKKTNKNILVSNRITFAMPEEHRPIFSFLHFIFNKLSKYLNLYLKNLND